jgi:hypothetical protein
MKRLLAKAIEWLGFSPISRNAPQQSRSYLRSETIQAYELQEEKRKANIEALLGLQREAYRSRWHRESIKANPTLRVVK